MITEDYVSYETAKLLKEKGFDEPCYAYWHEDENRLIFSYSMHAIRNITNPCFFGPAVPTLQMAMKWLRGKHNLGVFPSWSQVFGLYGCRMYYLKKGSQEFYSVGVRYNTYEEACEAAIKYCLENMI